jgi:hypothetical protein
MSEVTLAEVNRRVDGHERRFNDYVRADVYERDMKELREDIAEIKGDLKWATRFIAGQFVTLIIGLLWLVVDRLPL